jgi:hypothetical protein
MARSTSELLLAEIEKLRHALGKLDKELGRVQSRLAAVEGRLSQGADRRVLALARDPGKRLN